MLRAVVRDGQQQVLEQTPRWVIPAHILHTPEEALQVREKLAHQVLNPEVWPVFDLQVGYVDGMPARLWLCLDNLLLDGLSMQILLAELDMATISATVASAATRHLQDTCNNPRSSRLTQILWHGGRRT
ncbi:hypothetical protein GCM10029976_003150 [Kribbella albertanoniae]